MDLTLSIHSLSVSVSTSPAIRDVQKHIFQIVPSFNPSPLSSNAYSFQCDRFEKSELEWICHGSRKEE